MTTTAERDYMGRVASIGCVVCARLGYEQSPAEVHHIRAGQGMAQRAQNWLVLPLCAEHHRGKTGVHGQRTALHQVKVDELDLLADTIRSMFYQWR